MKNTTNTNAVPEPISASATASVAALDLLAYYWPDDEPDIYTFDGEESA